MYVDRLCSPCVKRSTPLIDIRKHLFQIAEFSHENLLEQASCNGCSVISCAKLMAACILLDEKTVF